MTERRQPHRPATRRHRAGHVVRGVAIDLRPLRQSRDFRLLWMEEIVTAVGGQITLVALLVQIYKLTGSPAAVGLVGLVEFVPLVVGTVVGGPLIDRYDRRTILLATIGGFAIAAGVLLSTSVASHPPLWIVYAAAGTASAVSGVDAPATTATAPNLVGKELLPAAVALKNVMWSVSSIAGPGIGGIVIGTLGLPWAYTLHLVALAAGLVLVLAMKPMPPTPREEPPMAWKAIKEGFAYLKRRRVLQSAFAIDLVAMIFGLPEALFPVIAVTEFHRGASVVGALFASLAVGALVAALTTGWVGRVRHQGRAVIWAVLAWGAGITAFGFVGNHLLLALALLAFAGGADTISAIFRGTILQSSVPDDLRGRLSAMNFLVVAGGPRLGNLEAGVVASLYSPAIAIASGGLLTIAGAGLIALLVPEFRRYHSGEDTMIEETEGR